MPWERRPAWLYLPHLTDEQPGADDNAGEGSCMQALAAADEVDGHGQRRADGGLTEDLAGSDGRVRPSLSKLSAASGPGEGGGEVAMHPEDITDRADTIRGQEPLPGAHADSDRVDGLGSSEIRGQNLLPGTGSGRRRHLSDVNEGGEGNTASGESQGLQRGSRLQVRGTRRRQGAPCCILRSLEDHAERVAAKKRRQEGEPPPPTPAERMAALRERLASKKGASGAVPSGGNASSAAASFDAHHGNSGGERAGGLRQLSS